MEVHPVHHMVKVGNVYLIVRNFGGGIVGQYKKKAEAEAELYRLMKEGEA